MAVFSLCGVAGEHEFVTRLIAAALDQLTRDVWHVRDSGEAHEQDAACPR